MFSFVILANDLDIFGIAHLKRLMATDWKLASSIL